MSLEPDTSPGALVITGGTRGIGASIAIAAAAHQHPLALIYRSREAEAHALAQRLRGQGSKVALYQADVGDGAQVRAVFGEIAREFGAVHGLVNNAGTTGGRATLDELHEQQLDQVFRTNVQGAFLCAQQAARLMPRAGTNRGGAIVNVSSSASQLGAPGVWVHYAASKAALEAMSAGLAKELAPAGIRVNVVRCGVIDTEVHAGHGMQRLEQLLFRIPMGRMGQAGEVASAVNWLLSPQASYVTGTVIDVAGGL
ncbi:MAG TPA: SDR family oxidoreductase [Ramlibacter sp.]|nr:SDR family oxidoreductase [Ramlibacter sp.]